jgi:hypothetical protein
MPFSKSASQFSVIPDFFKTILPDAGFGMETEHHF